jgi:hypothetical protein
MTTKFLSGFEREQLHGLSNSYDCMQCREPITNPICHDCLGKQVASWLAFYPSIRKKMMPKLKSYIKEVNNTAVAAVRCASCSKKKAALCPYCFTEEIFNMLKRSRVDKMIIMDFLSIFNFDLKHEGYIQEAIKEGLY